MTIYHIMYTFHNNNNREMSCVRFTLVTINTLHTSNIVFFNKGEQKNREGNSPDKNNHHMQNKIKTHAETTIFQNVGEPASTLLLVGPVRKDRGDKSNRKKK